MNDVVAEIAAMLIQDEFIEKKTPFKAKLDVGELNYSLQSLSYLEDFLLTVKKIQSLTDIEYTTLILRSGAYTGEVIRKKSNKNFSWLTYDDAKQIFSKLRLFEKSPITYYLLVDLNESIMTFPMAKVEKFLDSGIEESLYSFAKVVGDL